MRSRVSRCAALLTLAGAVLIFTAGPCEQSSSDCGAEPPGYLVAFLEAPGAPSGDFTGAVVSFAPIEGLDGFRRLVVLETSGKRDSLKVQLPDDLLHLEGGRSYTFHVEHVGGFPAASALVIEDGDGLWFAGATDVAIGAHVLEQGLPGLELALADGGCQSRTSSGCYDAIVNRRLDARNGQDTSISLWNGQSGRLGRFQLTCLTAQFVDYSSNCADAGIPAVSWVLARSDSTD